MPRRAPGASRACLGAALASPPAGSIVVPPAGSIVETPAGSNAPPVPAILWHPAGSAVSRRGWCTASPREYRPASRREYCFDFHRERFLPSRLLHFLPQGGHRGQLQALLETVERFDVLYPDWRRTATCGWSARNSRSPKQPAVSLLGAFRQCWLGRPWVGVGSRAGQGWPLACPRGVLALIHGAVRGARSAARGCHEQAPRQGLKKGRPISP